MYICMYLCVCVCVCVCVLYYKIAPRIHCRRLGDSCSSTPLPSKPLHLLTKPLPLILTKPLPQVILAARLMQNANCCVLVNEDTYKTSCGSAVFEKICSIKVKGRDDKIKVYRPVESERRITKKLASGRLRPH